MAIDVVVLLAYFAVIIWVGLTRGARETSLEGYALGNRSIPWWAILASILAAEISAATFLGAPGEGFANRNFAYAQLAIGTILARIIVSYVFLKPYYDYKVVSIYEFLEIRFGTATKRVASFVFLITRALASGTRLYVAAILLVIAYEMISGTKPDAGEELFIYLAALVFIVLLTAIYTTLGGIKAVVWTDVIQACVLVVSLGAALWVLLSRIPDGWSGALPYLQEPGNLSFFTTGIDWNLGLGGNIRGILGNEYTIFAALLGATFITMATHGIDQDMVQRMLTAKDHHASRRAVILSGIIDMPIVLAFLLVGTLLWVFYQIHPDPDLPTKNPHIFPYFIMHELPPVVRGLLVAGVMATAMGSLSTALNALATTFARDWYQACFRPKAGDAELLLAARWSTVGFAGALILIGGATAWVVLMVPGSRILPIVLGIFGYTYGSLLGVFLVGMLTKTRGNDTGNLIAMAFGFLVVGFTSGLFDPIMAFIHLPRETAYPWLPEIAFSWRVTFGTLATVAVALLFRSKPASTRIAPGSDKP